ncbi:scoloptoxin SSD14-like [Dermacentor variabilis]|uniref:scoloptoxin SSD14-like n=1 Tax=Dermacentor variabilis TaxID=34621 RepID=UPI003F5CAF16
MTATPEMDSRLCQIKEFVRAEVPRQLSLLSLATPPCLPLPANLNQVIHEQVCAALPSVRETPPVPTPVAFPEVTATLSSAEALARPPPPTFAPSPSVGSNGLSCQAWSPHETNLVLAEVTGQQHFPSQSSTDLVAHTNTLASTAAMLVYVLLIYEVFGNVNSSSETSKDANTDSDKNIPYNKSKPSNSTLGNYTRWAVSMDAAQCVNVSRNIFQKNGSTADAAIATLLCMGVVIPHSMGIGGGFIATVYNQSTKKAQILIARERAPENVTQDLFVGKKTASIVGGLAVAVPGELRGYKELHNAYGKLNWSELFYDAILLAKCGFPIGKHLADALKAGEKYTFELANKTRRAFMNNKTGKILQEGEILIQEDLASTLEMVRDKGADYFYNGSLASEIAQEIKQNGGILTEYDLKNYSVTWAEPLTANFTGDLTMYSPPPPGSGAVLSYILGIMDGYRNGSDLSLEDSILNLHRFTESCKFGYAKRALLGDAEFVDRKELVKNMTSKWFAEQARSKVNDSCTYNNPEYYGFVNETIEQDTGTAHATFWGPDNIAISVSSTINYYFGSLIRTTSGILLNNEMDDFSTPGKSNIYGVAPSKANFIAPGKRPMSSMAPMVLVNSAGEVQLVLGGTGGSLITSGIALVTVRALWQNYTIKEAIDESRIHHQLIPNNLMVEPSFSNAAREALRKYGHNVTERKGRFNVILGLCGRDGHILANSDYRKGGTVDGE